MNACGECAPNSERSGTIPPLVPSSLPSECSALLAACLSLPMRAGMWATPAPGATACCWRWLSQGWLAPSGEGVERSRNTGAGGRTQVPVTTLGQAGSCRLARQRNVPQQQGHGNHDDGSPRRPPAATRERRTTPSVPLVGAGCLTGHRETRSSAARTCGAAGQGVLLPLGRMLVEVASGMPHALGGGRRRLRVGSGTLGRGGWKAPRCRDVPPLLLPLCTLPTQRGVRPAEPWLLGALHRAAAGGRQSAQSGEAARLAAAGPGRGLPLLALLPMQLSNTPPNMVPPQVCNESSIITRNLIELAAAGGFGAAAPGSGVDLHPAGQGAEIDAWNERVYETGEGAVGCDWLHVDCGGGECAAFIRECRVSAWGRGQRMAERGTKWMYERCETERRGSLCCSEVAAASPLLSPPSTPPPHLQSTMGCTSAALQRRRCVSPRASASKVHTKSGSNSSSAASQAGAYPRQGRQALRF